MYTDWLIDILRCPDTLKNLKREGNGFGYLVVTIKR
jgi:hypothetical protein